MDNVKTLELNEIYTKVNKSIDGYLRTHKVKPTEIYKYVNKNLSKFLEMNDLEINDQNKRIIMDVIQHRKGMEKDKVYKFEQYIYNVNESFLPQMPASQEHETILADFYSTSVGHVQPLDNNYHLYEIKAFDVMIKAIIFSESEIENLKGVIVEKVKDKILSQPINLDSIYGVDMGFDLRYNLSELVSVDQINLPNLGEVELYRVLSKLLPACLRDVVNIKIYRSTPQKHKNYLIWEVRDVQ